MSICTIKLNERGCLYIWSHAYWQDIGLLIVVYWIVNNSVYTVISRFAESLQAAHADT